MAHRALVTGISGFAGSFLAEHLLESNDAVLGCSPDGAWYDGSDSTLIDQVEVIGWDLATPDGPPAEVRRRIESFCPDVIYHLAALSVPDDCGHEEPTPKATAVNVRGTRQVLALAESLRSRPRVLFVSSSLVYAPVTRQAPRVDENAPVAPRRGYSKTKLAAEDEVRRACEANGCDAVIARAFQHTGPRQDSRMMLPSWSRQYALGDAQPVTVHTCDAQIDLTDVRDVVRAYRLLAERGRRAKVYNVGLGVARRSGDVLEMLRQLADPGRPVSETRPGFKQDPIADISRLVRDTGWQAVIPLEKTVADTYVWWQQQMTQSGDNP